MDRTEAVFAADHDSAGSSAADAEAMPGLAAESLVGGSLAAESLAGEPYFHVFQAVQKRGRDRLDAALAALVADRAAAFAVLTPREQAAIAWVEAVISSGKTQSSDGAYAALRRHFDEAAIAKLTALAGTASARAKLGALRRG